MSVFAGPELSIANLTLSLDAANPKSYRTDKNLINPGTWISGTTGAQPGFGTNGTTAENAIISDTDPFGYQSNLWEALPAGEGEADGGWNGSLFSIDNTKMYRFSVWVNRTVTGANGAFYLGLRGYDGANSVGVISRTTGVNSTNPYFYVSTNPPTQSELTTNEWTLVVAHVHPAGSGTGSANVNSGLYSANGVKKNITVTDYVWNSNNTHSLHRSYLYYSIDATSRQRWAYPRVDLVDGTEPSISNLINNRVNKLYTYNMVGTQNAVLRNNVTFSNANSGILTFDGTDDFISGNLTPLAFNSSSTIEAVVRLSDVTGLRAIFSHGRTAVAFNSGLMVSNGQIAFRNSNNDWLFPSPTTLSPNVWYHLVVSTDSNGTTAYCNGISQGSNVYKLSTCALSEWTIGRRSFNSNSERLSGSLAILNVYQNRALTEAEVRQNFNALRGRFGI